MQQPMNQPEPIGGQQAMQQQMVLCPVRFVYETQVLVQPGDQIQPNQTFFINPQNPPPWMQNRPQPNPVVYVQQLPNNMIQPVQQQMDQNQLYLQQNFANFQLQQHMLAQNHQDMRSMQLANIVPNMVQNVQQSIQSNERNINQNPNTGQIQANAQNMMQNQMTVARQVPNQGNQTVEVQRQVQFMNVRPQMSQQMNMTRPVMSLNQLQNMQAMTNMQNLQIQQANAGQTFVQNIGQRMPQNVNAVRPQIMPNNAMNVQNVNNINKPTNQPPQEANKAMNNTDGSPLPNVRNFAQNYNCRPIQPRRRFVENNANNLPKMQQQNAPVQQPKIQQQNVPQFVQQQQHIPVQTPPTQQQHQYNQERVNSHQIATNTAAATNYLNNPNVSRKRKSESPDETQNKMAVPPASQPIYKNLQQGIIITKLCNEIGTNTSPVHKPKLNANNPSNQAVQMNQSMPMVIVEHTEQSKQDINQIKTETRTVITPAPSENDKLIRNTVYTQARGRLLQDKISDSMPPQQVIENKPPESVQNTTETKTNIEPQTDNNTAMTEVPTDKVITVTIQSEKGATVSKAQADTIESRILQILESIPKKKNTQTQTPEKKPREVKKEVRKEIKVEGVKKNESSDSNENSVNKTVKNVAETKSEPKSEPQEEKIEIKEQKTEVKDEKIAATEKVVTKQDILTHVVDGYVIQESNFAFPIRKPLIEKTLQANPKAEAESMDALKECMKEEMKNTGVDVQLLPFHYLLLHCEKKKEEEEMADSKTLNPFTDLLHSTVKSWTVEDLSNHLLKYDWNETVSVFQDHEIDELESAAEAGVRSLKKSTLKFNCRLTLKKLLRHGNCSHKDTKKETDKQNTPGEANRITYGIENDGEEPEIPKNDSLIQISDIDIEYDIITPEINQEKVEMEIENLENAFENVVTEFETPGNYSNYFGEEIENPVNKSEIDEETEQELQSNDEFKVGYNNEQTIEHAHMLQANDEVAQMLQANYENAETLQPNEEADISKPNDKLKIEILEDIVIKHAPKSHTEILNTIRKIIVLKQGNSSSKVDSTDDVTAQEVFVHNSKVYEEINNRKDKILQANNEMNSNCEGIHNIDPKNNEHLTENTSTRTTEREIDDKSNNENTEKAPQFDNFKVPKEVTHSKKKIVKKQQPRFVLTHVVGGHIIQESNFAFPIREPQSQKNKPQSSNTEVTAPPIDVQEEEKVIEEESKTEEPAPTEAKEDEKVNQEKSVTEEPTPTEAAIIQEESVTEEPAPVEVQEENKEDVENGEFNPFARLHQSTVKSWTVEALSNHLLKCDWEETASLLQDNEIDGASLFMVTKTQLMIIGVNEEQADVISEFVQSGSSMGN